MDFVTRINLKTSGYDRKELIHFCLNNTKQCLAIGQGYVYKGTDDRITDYKEYYYAVKNSVKSINPALNIF